MMDRDFWEWGIRTVLGDTDSDIDYYVNGEAKAEDYNNAVQKIYAATEPGSPDRRAVIDAMSESGLLQPTDDLNYWYGEVGEADVANLGAAAERTVSSGSVPIPTAQRVGTTTVGSQTVPADSRLVRVTGPVGTDAGELFYLVGTVYGVEVAYRIGDREDLNATFGNIDNFSTVSTMTQAEFDGSDTLEVGTVDEAIGAGESLQAQFDRDMRSAGLENPPAWVVADKTAMATFVTSTNEGWSWERMWNAMSKTDAFGTRFAGFDTVMDQLGTSSMVAGIAEYTDREKQIRSSLLSSRGPQTDTSVEYVSSLIGAGWQGTEVGELLSLEKRVKDNPEAMQNINAILAYQGMEALSPDDFVSFLQYEDQKLVGNEVEPSLMFEAVNDAMRFQALLTEGIDVDLEFATELGTGTSDTIGSEEMFSRQAQLAAGMIGMNARELDLGKMGLTREDVIAAQFGEQVGEGKSVSEVNALLEKFARERSKAARGHTTVQSYLDNLGRPITAGFNG